MTSLVLSHFVNGVVDGIQVEGLGTSSDTLLVGASTRLSVHALLQVGLRIPYAVAQQLSKLRSVLSLFPSIALEGVSYFRITFAVSLTAHGQVHTNFGAFTHEVVVQVLDHLVVATFSYADDMFVSKGQRTAGSLFNYLNELAGRSLTQGALLGSSIAFIDVAANCTSKFLHFTS